MKITKFGHCCLLVEESDLRILTDPGKFTEAQNEVEGIDVVLVTHEHWDHIHVPSVEAILEKNPSAKIVTNTAVEKMLQETKIECHVVKDGETFQYGGVNFQSLEGTHAPVYGDMPGVLNTAFMVADRLFYPGDAWIEPRTQVDVLALPVAGPWMKISEAVDYALKLKPTVAFPVHDMVLAIPGMASPLFTKILGEHDIKFVEMNAGDTKDF